MSERDGVKVARTLREAILRLDLRPGAILDEAELTDRLKVSRTPVREAIIQLIADGLVVREGRKAKVAPLDLDDIPKLYDALLISSRLVHRLAAQNRSAGDLAAIAKHMEAFEALAGTGNGVLRSEVNHIFHQAISAAAGNRYIAAFYEQTLVGTLRLSRACFAGGDEHGEAAMNDALREHLAETMRQHRCMHAAIEARDVEASEALAVDHYRLTKRRIMTVLFDGSGALSGLEDLSLDAWP